MTISSKCACLIAATIAVVMTGSNLLADTWPVVLSGQAAPGIEGARFSGGISAAAVSSSGIIAFQAGIDVAGVQGYGIFKIAGGLLSPVALSGQTVPGAPGWSFGNALSEPAINNSAEIAFAASLGGGTTPTYAHYAVFAVSGGTFRRIVDTETQAPGLAAGWNFGSFSSLSMNDAGDIAFCSDFRPPAGYSGPVPGSEMFLLSKGSLRVVTNSCSSSSLNNRGDLVFVAGGAVSVLANGAVKVVARSGQPVPDSKVILDTMAYPWINDDGDVVFVNGHVSCSRVCSWLSNALVRSRGGVLEKIATGGDPVPGVTGAVFDSVFLEPRINNSALLFTSRMYLKGVTDQPDAGPIGVIGKFQDGRLDVIAREDELVEGIGTLDFIGSPRFGDPQSALVAFNAGANHGAASGIYTTTAGRFTLLFPQMADGGAAGGRWRTTFVLANRSTSPATATVSFYDDNGAPMNVPINGQQQAQLSLNVPALGVAQYRTDGAGPLRAGWASVQADQDLSGISLFSFYRDSGTLAGEVGAAAAVPLRSLSVFAQTGDGTSTGVALANPNQAAADVTLILRDSNSNEIARTSLSLPSMGHAAKYINELFPGNRLGALAGKIDISSTQTLIAITLRQHDAVFTSLPVIP